MNEYPDELYARSAGWAALASDPCWKQVGASDPGDTFEWHGHMWEIVCFFKPACCDGDEKIAIVRKEGSGLKSWYGIECPNGCALTYVVETEA